MFSTWHNSCWILKNWNSWPTLWHHRFSSNWSRYRHSLVRLQDRWHLWKSILHVRVWRFIEFSKYHMLMWYFFKKWEEFLSCIIYKCQTSEIICSLSYCLPYVRSFPSFHCSFQWPYNIMLPVLYYRAIRQKNETTKRSHIRHI